MKPLTRTCVSAAFSLLFNLSSLPAMALVDAPVDGFGDRMPLSDVVQALVPPGIKVVFKTGVDQRQLASWRGSPSWRHSLDESLAPMGLFALITDDRVVIGQPSPWQQILIWRADRGMYLQDVLEDWGRRVGVKPVFHGVYRYPIESPIAVEGDFIKAASMLVDSFSTSDPRPILDIWLDDNNFAVELTQGANQ